MIITLLRLIRIPRRQSIGPFDCKLSSKFDFPYETNFREFLSSEDQIRNMKANYSSYTKLINTLLEIICSIWNKMFNVVNYIDLVISLTSFITNLYLY